MIRTSKIPSIENWTSETCRRLAWQLRVLAQLEPAKYELMERWKAYYISQAFGAKNLQRPGIT
jgi:hypothetical protein